MISMIACCAIRDFYRGGFRLLLTVLTVLILSRGLGSRVTRVLYMMYCSSMIEVLISSIIIYNATNEVAHH